MGGGRLDAASAACRKTHPNTCVALPVNSKESFATLLAPQNMGSKCAAPGQLAGGARPQLYAQEKGALAKSAQYTSALQHSASESPRLALNAWEEQTPKTRSSARNNIACTWR